MRLSARIKCFKYLVYAYIILISICGGAELVIGSFLLWSHRQHSAIINNLFWEPFATVLFLGVVTLLLCYLGWTATAKKNRCYLGLFCACMVVLIVVHFLISGWSIALRAQITTQAEIAMEQSFDKFIRTTTTDQTHNWNTFQRDLQCCGVGGTDNYRKTTLLPWSCYDPLKSTIYDSGCLHVLTASIKGDLVKCAIVAVASALIQSLGIFCVIQLSMLLKKPTLNIPSGDNQIRPKHPRELLPLASTISNAPPTIHKHHPVKPNAPKIDTSTMKVSSG